MKFLLSHQRHWRVLALATALSIGLPLSACVEDVGLVNRTDPDKIDKTLFEGAWLYAQTTVDVPYSSAISFTGETNFGGSAKIIFDIQEKWLIAYPIIETVEGTEAGFRFQSIRKYWDPDNRDQFVEMFVGQPLAKWPIVSHFDVIRDYNTYNGAQSNEVVENTKDRPWYQRDYIRVGWHQQDVRTFFYELKGGQGANSYLVGQDKQGEPDEMTLDADGGYFDFVIRSDVWSAGQFYCSTFGLSPYDCAKTEVKARHSFKRLDHRRDYEPIRYHNNEHQDKFGFFLTERPYYDADYGSSYEGKLSFANRWNQWMTSYDFQRPTDDSGAELNIACFQDFDCDESIGERCQKDIGWFDDGYCAVPVPKPFSQRGLRPIIYHLNSSWHPDFIADAYATAEGWNDAFKESASWQLFYDERGEADTRGCTTSSDCGTADLLVDREVTYSFDGISCHTDAQCGSAVCGTSGFCASQRSCGATSPCAVGQTCSQGVCMTGGSPVMQKITATRLRGSSVIYAGPTTIVTHDTLDQVTKTAINTQTEAIVRFIHAAPEGGNLGLTVNGVTMPGGGFDENRDYDPQDPASGAFVGLVPAGSGLSFTVVRGGAEVATTGGDLVPGASYTVIYNGADVLVYGAALNDANQGIRFIHAGSGEGKLDFALTGVRLAKDLGYRQATGYESVAGKVQRATVTRAGARGDITCYTADGIGRCVGWGADLTEADLVKRQQMKDAMPELYVLCQNQFDELDAFDQANISLANATQATVLDGEPDRDGGYYGDAWYTYEKDGELYNPCGDAKLVPHPTQLKKVGDIRYSFYYWVNEPMRAGPLGYGPSLADPETGQIISATANIYGGGLLGYGQYAADLLGLVNGDISNDDIVTGTWVREYLKNKAADADPELATQFGSQAANAAPVMPKLDRHKGHQHSGADFGLEGKDIEVGHGAELEAAALENRTLYRPLRVRNEWEYPELNEYLADPKALNAAVQQAFPPVDAAYSHDRLSKIRGTWIEDMLVNNELMAATPAIDPGGELSFDDLMHTLSPASWASKFAMKKEEERTRFFAERNMYMADFVDDALWGLAQELKNKGLDPAEFRLAVSRRILRGVLEHEVGHTVGLRHNFSGSTDSFNFFDEYYSIRETGVILCQTNGWCDDIGNQRCAMQDCGADGDCFSGICQAGECVAPSDENGTDLQPTGVCTLPVGDTPCATNDQCGDGELCDSGQCATIVDQFLPRAWITDNEKAEKRTEYQYSTVMDYGGRINSDVHGLGKYDYAAIRFGYGGMVDTYSDDSKLRNRVRVASELTGQAQTETSYYLESDFWSNRGTGFYHPFRYLVDYIGVDKNLLRTPRPYEQVKYQKEMVYNDRREYLDYENIEVPYAFCSDEFRGNAGCYYFDMGIDMGEMAGHAQEQLEQYYVFDAFKRERLYYGRYGNPFGYFNRIMDRYLRVLGDAGMYYGFYDILLFRYSWYDSWRDDPLGGRTYERAARAAFAALQDSVSSPAPGSYVFDAERDAYMNISLEPGAPTSELDIPLGVGRFPYTRFGYELGYTYAEHPLWFGSFWEKIAALITLTDSTANFVDTAVGEQLNIGVGTSIGFNTVFAAEMNSFLGGIIAEEMPLYSGRVIQGKYTPPSTAMRSNLGVDVEPALNNFTLKLYAAVFGLAYLPAGFDPQFVDATAVFLEDEATFFDHATAPGITPHRFTDPIGGKVYIAFDNNYAAFGTESISSGAVLIDKAQDLADQWELATGTERARLERRIHEVRETLDLLRGLNQIYGSSTLGF